MEPNQNNNPKDGKSGGDKRLKRLLLTLIISVAIILLFSTSLTMYPTASTQKPPCRISWMPKTAIS